MITTIRKLAFTLAIAFAIACALTILLMPPLQWSGMLDAAQTTSSSQSPESSVVVLAELEPEWRYTRFGWQDANEWAMVGQIEYAPARRLDNLHPVVLAMLILFGVLVSAFWASNEWELAQLMGERDQPSVETTDQ